MKQFLYFATISLAALFTIFGSLLLVTRYQLLQAETYNSALTESGIYQVSSDILQEKTTEGLVVVSKGLVLRIGFGGDQANIDSIFDRILVSLINTLIDQQSGRLVADLFERINLAGVMQQTMEQWIAEDLAWLKGEREANEIFDYIPEPEQIEKFKDSTFTQNLSELALVSSGYSNLPNCLTEEDYLANLQLAENGKILQITCTTPEIQQLVDEQVATILPTGISDQINTGVERQIDAFGIQPILDTLTKISLTIAQLKQSLLELRSYIALSQEYAIGMLLIGLTLATASMFVIKKQMLVSFLSVYAISGVSIMLISLMFRWFFAESYIAQMSLSDPSVFQSALSASQSIRLSLSIQEVVRQIFTSLVKTNIYFGLVMTSIATIGLALVYSYHRWLIPAFTRMKSNALARSSKSKQKKK